MTPARSSLPLPLPTLAPRRAARSRAFAALVALGLGLDLGGCTFWRPTTVPLQQAA